jgi:hypothetical protein
MPGVKRTAVLEGVVLSTGFEKAGSPVVVASLDFQRGDQLDAELNARKVMFGFGYPEVVLRGADLRWVGKKCKLTVTIEVEP